MKVFIALLLVAVAAASSISREDCPSNKEFGSFGDCPDSCYSLDHPVRACTLKLNWGCKCKAGYVLREDKVFTSDCIRPEECL
ncbi:hypothetical protein AVEN_193755-1 [Araneus ventricosus]|uniref:TIL domain-containing protein n=1 Tax=Araneus ventricosus TaxID=182803 RepID=A0A4Y2DMN4_ARAVE|nr:hypothetical protein AVEN_193755-1 [Araneus ventricosus]